MVGFTYMFHLGAYVVQAYTRIPGEQWSSWHTLRAFKNQGDAILFRDIITNRSLDVHRYIKSYISGRIVISMKTKPGDQYPTLTFEKNGKD